MMSPDPPREDTSDENEGIKRGTVIQFLALNDEDVGEGEHELDFSNESGNEDDTDVDDEGVPEPIPNTGDLQSRVRGRYQLLIPFPASDNQSDEVSEVEFRHVDSNSFNSSETFEETSQFELQTEPNQNCQVKTAKGSGRDIQLTVERAETIKNVMKGISLPTTSIPGWAKEMTEDAWKTRLNASLGNKTQNEPNSSPHSKK